MFIFNELPNLSKNDKDEKYSKLYLNKTMYYIAQYIIFKTNFQNFIEYRIYNKRG